MDEVDKTLAAAHHRISELRENESLFTPLKVSFRWTPADGDATDFKSFPTNESIKAAALDIRHFLAPGSSMVMGRLVKALRTREGIDAAKLDEFYRVWREQTGDRKSGYAPMGVALNMDGKDLTLKEQIDLWMNGKLFHADPDKADKLSRMYFSSFRDQSWMIFVNTLQRLANLLFYFDRQFLQPERSD